MPEIVLGPCLRYVDSGAATIWLQTDEACEVEILGFRERTWCIEGLHFALIAVDGLQSGTTTPYEVRLDGEVAWPGTDSPFPPSVIRTFDGGAVTLAFGSCRITRPHEPPYVLRSHESPAGHGIDALRTYALRAARATDALPTMLLMLGDQIYADEPSPHLEQEMDGLPRPQDAPEDELASFGEYALAYREAWSDPVIRWLLSTVSCAMVFDDHEIHDMWRVSDRWMRKMLAKPWFERHICAGLMAYWVFQHLGNLSPAQLGESALYQEIRVAPDGGRALAGEMAQAGRQVGHSRWSFSRKINGARLVVIDSRAGRDVTPGARELISPDEWDWIRDQAIAPAQHLLLASSVPFLLAPGLHHVEAWDEAVADGAWGRPMAWVAERLRLIAVMDHWASFQRTHRKFAAMVDEIARGELGEAPSSVVMLSGDVHHCYLAEVGFPHEAGRRSAVWQAVCSAFRKELAPHEKRVIAFGHSRLAERLARRLSRAAGVTALPFDWRITDQPAFANQIATLVLDGDQALVRIEAVVEGEWRDPQLHTVIERTLTTPAARDQRGSEVRASVEPVG